MILRDATMMKMMSKSNLEAPREAGEDGVRDSEAYGTENQALA
jgi:hypothetical protein